MHYYQSLDATITADDAPVGTDPVSGLSADNTRAVSIALTAPSRAGTYYYGACVQRVDGESNTDNNCSTGVQVTVGSGDWTVNIADANLRAVIAEALGKAPNAPITEGEMAMLTTLEARTCGHQRFDRAGICHQPDMAGSLRQPPHEYLGAFGLNQLERSVFWKHFGYLGAFGPDFSDTVGD